MKNSLSKLFLAIPLVSVTHAIAAAEVTWLTDLGRAQTQAKAENKMVLVFFHDSDGCLPCIQMQKQVFDSAPFAAFARQALVLVDVDLRESAPTSAEAKSAQLALVSKFNVGAGVPSIVLLNPAGDTVFQETGYAGGGPAEVLPKLHRHVTPPSASDDNPQFTNLSVAEFAKLAADKRYVILDVRTSGEFQAGHLAGAINLDVNAPDFQKRAQALDHDQAYLVHCASGGRSVKACNQLGQLDFHRLYNLPGGFKAWVKAGLPVEK